MAHFTDLHEETEGVAGFFTGTGIAKSESMDVVNDPRFFTDNVINYRLAAFGGLAVVSGLMTGNAMGGLFDMDKNMQIYTQNNTLFHFNGLLQCISFVLLMIILGINIFATYIGVAQPYHTIRLMTAGPTGFDSAASYYLNKNITAYRHAAIRLMLVSLPLYIFQMALRLVVKFDRTTQSGGIDNNVPKETPMESRVQGYVSCAIMTLMALGVYCIHAKHFEIFKDRYNQMHARITGPQFTEYMQGTMASKRGGDHLDV